MSFKRTSKTLRASRYFDLRDKHFTPREAQEFSKLTRQYPALKRLIASRTALWANFVQESRRKGWESENKRKQEWTKKIVGFYERQRAKHKRDRRTGEVKTVIADWVVEKDVHGRKLKRPRISPWSWYDTVFQRLPDELKWDSPKSKRTKQPDVQVDKIMVARWISDLEKTIERTNDPREIEQYQSQIRNLRRSLRNA